jgi:hypothetical protein
MDNRALPMSQMSWPSRSITTVPRQGATFRVVRMFRSRATETMVASVYQSGGKIRTQLGILAFQIQHCVLLGRGAFQSGGIGFTEFLAWLIHRAYHLYAVPTLERKVRVLADWLVSALFGRDIVSVEDARHPRAAFVLGRMPERHTSMMYEDSTKNKVVDIA